MSCLDEQTVVALLAGALTATERTAAEAHLAGCADCLEVIAELARPAAETAPIPTDRYAIGAEIARGGMGRIFEALDRVLDRRVAIKKLRGPAIGTSDRFVREMRLTARLQHPAIVPIYDAGVLPDGEPFYAMRMVAGQTLDAALAGATTLDARLAFVPAVLTVADAIAYAHGEGIIHRDLKPSNVLVGPFGEVVILDWGIAKDLRAIGSDDDDGAAASGEPIEPLTVDGAVMGTPGYMAPEQAAGGSGDERTDVYGLGAMLYQVLAGAPPHGRDRTTPVTPVGDRQPGVPADLVAIVERALATAPERRYPSARELSDDLRRFSTGRLVAAHRYSLGQLLRRFVARHRAAVAVAAASLVMLAIVSIIAIDRVVDQRRVALGQRDAAEELVHFILRELRERLEPVGRLDVLATVGERVDAYYDRIGVGSTTEAIRRATAQAILGDAHLAAGEIDAALVAYRASLAWTERSDGDAVAQCRAQQRIGDALRARGELDGAAAAHHACLAAGADPERAAASLVELGSIARARGQLDEAAALLEQAHALAEQHPALPVPLLMKVDDERGILAIESGNGTAAQRAFAANLARARSHLAAQPEDPDRQHGLVSCLHQLGQSEMEQGDLVAAESRSREALSLALALTARDPANTSWLRSLELAHNHLGNLAMARGDLADAIVELTASDAIMRGLVARDPRQVDWQGALGGGALLLADAQREIGDTAAARASLERARDIFAALAANDPPEGAFRRDLAIVLAHAGDLAKAEGRTADAAAAFTEALAIRRVRLAAADTTSNRVELAEILLLLDRAIDAAAVIEPVRAQRSEDPYLASLLVDIDAATPALTPPP